jgi:uncharacterized membrane protein
MTKIRWTKEEIKEYKKKQDSYFYFNKEDSNIFIPKDYGFGWTFNWANPISWVILLVIIGIIVFRKFYR